jgi:L-ascorbate metabolism protein UlaG (beta-lactamase superfamily)
MRIAVDDVRIVATGRLRRQLTEDEIDGLGHVDVLVVPVGGGDAVGVLDAAKLVHAIEPSVVVPARFGTGDGGELDPVGKFAKEMGLVDGTWDPQPRLVLTGSTGETDETRVVVLEARAG